MEMRAGCLFAATAAHDPSKYGWCHRVVRADPGEIDAAIHAAIGDGNVTTLSLLFPAVCSPEELLGLVGALKSCKLLILEQTVPYGQTVCLGFRAMIGVLRSYVTGFGDFDFLPPTRRTPYVEITMRVKPRPQYEFVFKEAPDGIIHLADLDMQGLTRAKLQKLWDQSFVQTEKQLGAETNLRSAAKTTYGLPVELFQKLP
jgi:hypothetical protein